MFHQQEVRELIPGLTPFPTDVFVPEQAWLGQHLLPLMSIDLGILRPELAGTVTHMLCPIEPYEGYIGDHTTEHHSDYTAPNWFAFALTAENQLRFLGNEGYFLNAPIHAEKTAADGDLIKHTSEMRESYRKAKAYFAEHGKLACYSRYGRGEPRESDYLDALGGEFWAGTWSGHPPIPPAFELLDNNEDISIHHRGKAFFPVAEVAGYNWCATGADAILMFYEPESRTVLFTFDWT